MELSISAEQWEEIQRRRIDHVLGDVDRWARVAYCGWRPKAGSDIHRSSDPGLRFTPEALVGIGLMSFGDAMHASALLWRATERKTLPIALGTLLRQAMLGAATAIWLTEPIEPDEARSRMALAAVNAIERANAADSCIVKHTTAEANRAGLQARVQHANEAITAIRSAYQLGKTQPPKDTTVWDSAAKVIYPDSPQDAGRVSLAWRLLSGDAHSLVWVHELRARLRGDRGTPVPGDPDKFAIRVALDTSDYGGLVEDAVAMGSTAMRLAIRRGMRPMVLSEFFATADTRLTGSTVDVEARG